MAGTIYCDVVSVEEQLFSGDVRMVIATGSLGEIGIMSGHTPLLTGIRPGPVRLVLQGGREEVIFASGGYLEVQPGLVTVLADTAVRANDLDEAAAQEAQRQAERELADRSSEIDFAMAEANLFEASAQLRTIHRLREQARRG